MIAHRLSTILKADSIVGKVFLYYSDLKQAANTFYSVQWFEMVK